MSSDTQDTPPAPNKRSDVGYKRPPKGSQFKKGQSGNPSGRPKKQQGDSGLLDLVKVVKNGKRVKMTALEVNLHSVLQRAVAGELKSIVYLLGEFHRYQVSDKAAEEQDRGGGVVRPRLFATMPERMEEILRSTSKQPYPPSAIRAAREAYLEELPPEERQRAVEERGMHVDLEPGSELVSAAYYREVFLHTARAKAMAKPEDHPYRKVIEDFARQKTTLTEGPKTRRLTHYAVLQFLFRKEFLKGKATIQMAAKLGGKAATHGQKTGIETGVMVAPPDLPPALTGYSVKLANVYAETRPTLESILLPAQVYLDERRAEVEKKPLPPDHAERKKRVERFNRLGPGAQARLKDLMRNPPDAYPEFQRLRPKDWIPPKPPEILACDDMPPSARPRSEARAPSGGGTDSGSVLSRLEALRTKRDEIVQAFEVEVQALAKLDLETRKTKSLDYNRRRCAALAAIDREISHVESQRSMADIVQGIGERLQKMQDSDASKPVPPSRRGTTYR